MLLIARNYHCSASLYKGTDTKISLCSLFMIDVIRSLAEITASDVQRECLVASSGLIAKSIAKLSLTHFLS
jgi:hypothetical protein